MSGVTEGCGSQRGLALLHCPPPSPPTPSCSPGISSSTPVFFFYFFFFTSLSYKYSPCLSHNQHISILTASAVWETVTQGTLCRCVCPLFDDYYTSDSVSINPFAHAVFLNVLLRAHVWGCSSYSSSSCTLIILFCFCLVFLESKEKKMLLVSSPFCYLTLHSLIEQHSGTNY